MEDLSNKAPPASTWSQYQQTSSICRPILPRPSSHCQVKTESHSQSICSNQSTACKNNLNYIGEQPIKIEPLISSAYNQGKPFSYDSPYYTCQTIQTRPSSNYQVKTENQSQPICSNQSIAYANSRNCIVEQPQTSQIIAGNVYAESIPEGSWISQSAAVTSNCNFVLVNPQPSQSVTSNVFLESIKYHLLPSFTIAPSFPSSFSPNVWPDPTACQVKTVDIAQDSWISQSSAYTDNSSSIGKQPQASQSLISIICPEPIQFQVPAEVPKPITAEHHVELMPKPMPKLMPKPIPKPMPKPIPVPKLPVPIPKLPIPRLIPRFKPSLKLAYNSKLVHSGERKFACEVPACGKKFFTSPGLTIHLRAHNKAKSKSQCHICDKSFGKKRHLTLHLKRHLDMRRPHVCAICSKTYRMKHELTAHMLRHIGEKDHVCSICKAAFHSITELKTHLKTHSAAEERYSCHICRRTFSLQSKLQIHMRVHTGERPHICSVCQKGFTQKSIMRIHMQRHSGLKPYECDICERTFAENYHLKLHKRTHTGERPFVCDTCGKAFKDNSGLKNHKQTH